MPNWQNILEEIKAAKSNPSRKGNVHDFVRRKYIAKLGELTQRHVIAYYSGWLQNRSVSNVDLHINDADMNSFMTVIHELKDRKEKGLDLILHTPGGEVGATKAIVDYLRSMFGTNIRVFVPQLAMSAGTMIACSCKEIWLGKHSSLGPIDPQIRGIPAHGVVEEFLRAVEAVKKNDPSFPVWQTIIAKYDPAFVGECEKIIKLSVDMVFEWLKSGMFEKQETKATQEKIKKIIVELGDHSLTKSHDLHISFESCKNMGLVVMPLESKPELQDAVLSVHHSYIHTFSGTLAYKIIENHMGGAFISSMPPNLVLPPQIKALSKIMGTNKR